MAVQLAAAVKLCGLLTYADCVDPFDLHARFVSAAPQYGHHSINYSAVYQIKQHAKEACEALPSPHTHAYSQALTHLAATGMSRSHQPDREAVVPRQRFAIHLISQYNVSKRI